MMAKRPTADEIEAARTPAGGWTRDQLASWGVAWPPPKGWKAALLAEAIGTEEAIIVNAQCALHEALLKAKLKRKDLARRLGVSEARVSQMFADDANLTLRSLARAFHAAGKRLEIRVRKL